MFLSFSFLRSLEKFLFFLIFSMFLFGVLLFFCFPQYFFPYSLSLLSGFSTVAGGLLVVHRTSPVTFSSLGFSCGLASGVMIFVGAFDFLILTISSGSVDPSTGIFCFLIGFLSMFFLLVKFPLSDFLPLESIKIDGKINFRKINEGGDLEAENLLTNENANEALNRVVRFSFVSTAILAIHNCPEGFAVFLTTIESAERGIRTAVAILLHNIVEGIVVATPIYFLTQSRSLALKVTALSGLTEPLGAIFSFFLASTAFELSEFRISLSLCLVGGLMTAVSIVELMPEGRKFDGNRTFFKGAAAGISILAIAKWGI